MTYVYTRSFFSRTFLSVVAECSRDSVQRRMSSQKQEKHPRWEEMAPKARVAVRIKEAVNGGKSHNRSVDLDALTQRFHVMRKKLALLLNALRRHHSLIAEMSKSRTSVSASRFLRLLDMALQMTENLAVHHDHHDSHAFDFVLRDNSVGSSSFCVDWEYANAWLRGCFGWQFHLVCCD